MPDLPKVPVQCDISPMGLYRFICCLLAVFVIAGLVSAPLATPVVAMQLPAGEATAVSAMSDDMPCCQHEQKNNNGCKECPVAMCALMFAQAEPSSSTGIQISFQTRRLSLALNDLIADGLIGPPPDHPPRILT
ncbi:MAG TPA: hypothetical protein VJ728_17330 [Candidatus Binataceae bacterium]|nr:hypothetical protein [Candidatus Binataceae bacterium]